MGQLHKSVNALYFYLSYRAAFTLVKATWSPNWHHPDSVARVPGYTPTLKKNQLITSAPSVQPVGNHSQPFPLSNTHLLATALLQSRNQEGKVSNENFVEVWSLSLHCQFPNLNKYLCFWLNAIFTWLYIGNASTVLGTAAYTVLL